MNWIIGITIVAIVGYILDREIYFYEAVHLGPRVQAWLYDRWSRKYDEDKRESQLQDDEMLAGPLVDAIRDTREPFILDFATGTGRLSHALTCRPEFAGHIVALDLSQGMLEQAASKLDRHLHRVEFLRWPTLPLPFPDASFDTVICYEVVEHVADPGALTAEIRRVLRSGGTLGGSTPNHRLYAYRVNRARSAESHRRCSASFLPSR